MQDDHRALCLLVLPGVLEDLEFSARGRDLLRAPGVVATEPARWRPRGQVGAANVARRVLKRLPGALRVVVILHPRDYFIARAMLARRGEDIELWYGPLREDWDDEGLADLDRLARERAALVFDPRPDPERVAFQANAELWARLEALSIGVR